jgi:SOS response regulatory protein OraA/RecX
VSGSRPSCDDKAAELLARRPHFRAQLSAKLAGRGYPDDEIALTLDRLERRGWLDDRRTAAEFAERRLARGPVGRRRLAAELARRGAPSEAVSEALEQLPADDRAAASAAAARWRGRGGPAALARHLDRLGFGGAAIRAALEEAGAGHEDETPPADPD